MKRIQYISILILVALLLAACGGGAGQPNPSQVEAGKRLFEQVMIGSNAGCATCHSRQAEVILVGPSLAGIATHATEHKPGMTVEDYLRESIVDPNATILHGFNANVIAAQLVGGAYARADRAVGRLPADLEITKAKNA